MMTMRWMPAFLLLADLLCNACDSATVVDVHTHFIPAFYHQLQEQFNVTPGVPNPPWNASLHLQFMDSVGINLSILSTTTPGARFSSHDVQFGRKLARRLNKYAAKLSRKYPERFKFLATLTLPDVPGSVVEAIYSLDALGASGVKVESNSYGVYFGDPSLDPLMEVLNARNVTVFIHPARSADFPDADKDPLGYLPVVFDFEVDIARAALNGVKNNVSQRFPNLKIQLAHSGGFIPFQGKRLAGSIASLSGSTSPVFLNKALSDFLAGLRSYYFDIATVVSSSSIPCLLDFAFPTNILYGSDWPFTRSGGAAFDKEILDSYPLTSTQRHQITSENAQILYHLPNASHG